ncbi:porin family protein [Aureisphaera galaxeae]|uniref:porin family protein n=1 Tax=Aureisphaera galaxeae TaxID=1538023 RepID=UPI0023507876|nr:porin family protein [Aureisphaera galaxeae]MDC8004388.1 porin family protein [Aureisphaera galaxeae]
MKKLFTMLVVAVFAFTINASAQEISFGAKAGLNLASINGDDADDANFDGRTSFHVGAVVNIGIGEFFAVQPEVVYSAQGFTAEEEGVDVTGKLDYLNIPVLADFTIAEGLSLQGGPQFGFNITSEAEADGETEDIDDVESVDVAAGIGAQYKLPALGLFFQARYVIGLSDVVSDFDGKNANLSLSVGWFFN